MIIDCFLFYNELGILKKRLKYLSRIVDKFIIVESTVTHAGNPKPLYFKENKALFKEWEDKIIHIIVEDNPTDINPWRRENHQRMCIMRGIDDSFNDGTLVMISDIDEIPNISSIQLPENHDVVSVHMTHFVYNFNYHQVHEPWFGTVITTLGNLKKVGPQYLRDNRWKFPYIKFGGWHLSSFGENKINNYTHYADDKHKNNRDFKKYIEEGLHADGVNKLMKTTEDMLKNIPKCILND